MTLLDDAFNTRPRRGTRPTTALGRVVRAPATEAAPIAVVLVDFSSAAEYEVPASNWAAFGDALPAVRDRCLVIFDDRGDAWVATFGGGYRDPASTFMAKPGDPAADDGVDGTVLLNTATLEMWGPKAAGAWPSAAFAKLLPLP